MPWRNSRTGARELFREAWRYWEARRILYNAILAIVAMNWLVFTWPHFRHALAPQSLGFLLFLAFLANLCYSAAYLADAAFRVSALQKVWRRWRWAVFLAGTLLAVVAANYWIADEIYPYVR